MGWFASVRRIWILLLLLLPLVGCTSGPPLAKDLEFKIVTLSQEKLKKSSKNKYAILMRSHLYDRDGYLPDKYITNDLSQIAKLLCHKGYKVWYASSLSLLYEALVKLQKISDKNTKTFFAYSGKGDKFGLRLIGKYVSKTLLIIPPNVTVEPDKIIPIMVSIKGQKAMLINACEAGIFTDFAGAFRVQGRFLNGTIITSCAVGQLTTPYERLEMSATFATFVSQYSNDLDKVIDLCDMDIGTVGGWWYNFMHRMSNIIDRFRNPNIKPVSYDTVIYRGGSFKL